MYALGQHSSLFARAFQSVQGVVDRPQDTDSVDDNASTSSPSTDGVDGQTDERASSSPTAPLSTTPPPRGPSELSSRTAVSDDPDYCEKPCQHHPAKDPLLRNQTPHAQNLNRFVRSVFKALKTLYPRTRGAYNVYDKAHILFIRWQDDDLDTYQEIADLKNILSKLHITANPVRPEDLLSEFHIPSHDLYKDRLEQCLQEKKFAFTANATDLLVIYYGGHAKMNASQDCIWYPSLRPPAGCYETPQINWTEMQDIFRDREGEVVFILDCCCASAGAPASRSAWKGYKELFAACGKLEETEGVNDNSFTRSLIRQLEVLCASGQSTTIRALHSALTSGQIGRGLKHTPISVALSKRAHDGETWALSFAPRPAPDVPPPPNPPVSERQETDETRVLISIRLHDPAVTLDIHNWSRWLKLLTPADIANIEVGWTDSWADYVRLEGIFDHGSKLLLLSLPISLYKLMPPDTTCYFVDTVLSSNHLVRPSSPKGQEADAMETATTTPKIDPTVLESDDVWSIAGTLVGSLGEPPYAPPDRGEQTSRLQQHTVAHLGRNKFSLVPQDEDVQLGSGRKDEVIGYSDERIANVPDFMHRPLSGPQNMYRLIRLLPGTHQNPEIHCEIVHARYDDNGTPFDTIEPHTLMSTSEPTRLDYEAVSWSWGPNSLIAALLILSEGRVYKMRVTRDCVLALKHLRNPLQTRLLWIDAACINMADSEEVNNQVKIIPHIFSRARKACVWLGEADTVSSVAISFVKDEIMVWRNLDSNGTSPDKWAALFSFMQRPWFSLRWVVQEITLARESVMYCGHDHIHWRDFAAAIEIFTQAWRPTNHIYRTLQNTAGPQNLLRLFEISSELPASQLVEVTGRLYRLREKMAVPSELGVSSGPGFDVKEPSFSSYRPQSDVAPSSHILHQSLLSLESLVSSLYIFKHTEPRDAVYSLLALANDVVPIPRSPHAGHQMMPQVQQVLSSFCHAKPYPVDYSQPYADFCKDFVLFCIQSNLESMPHQSLDIICRPWASTSQVYPHSEVLDSDNISSRMVQALSEFETKASWRLLLEDPQIPLPSWVCPVSRAPFALFPHPGIDYIKMGRLGPGSLVGMPGGRHNYNAARRVVDLSSMRFRKRTILGHYSLYLRGFIVDEVAHVAASSQGGSIPTEWIQLAHWDHISQDPPDEFWRTLVADRGLYTHNAPYYYLRACKEAIKRGDLSSGAIDTTKLLNDGSDIVAEFCRRVQSIIWSRSMFRTKLGYLGLARDTMPGDFVGILNGCTVPVIIRRSERKSDQQLEKETLVDRIQALKAVYHRLEQRLETRRLQRERLSKMSGEERDVLSRETVEFNAKLQARKPHADVRSAATKVLSKQSALLEEFVQAVAALLKDPQWDVRSAAAGVLSGQSALPEEIVQAVATLLKDPVAGVRLTAAEALGQQSVLPSKIVQTVAALLKDRERHVRSAAAKVLSKQSALPNTIVQAVAALLKDLDAGVRLTAAEALGQQSALPSEVVQTVAALLRDPHAGVRLTAAEALGQQSALPSEVVQAVAALLKDPDAGVRLTAAEALGQQSALPSEVVQAMASLLRDPDGGVRSGAVDALSGQSALPEEIVQAVAAMLKDPDADVRSAAAKALSWRENSLKASPTFKGTGDDKYHFYRLIGESYIHGIMEGEAQVIQGSHNSPDQLFEIR